MTPEYHLAVSRDVPAISGARSLPKCSPQIDGRPSAHAAYCRATKEATMATRRTIRIGTYFIDVRGNGRIELSDTPSGETDPMPAVEATDHEAPRRSPGSQLAEDAGQPYWTQSGRHR
jgi:hypothetical protein